jgi:hypothetical protein
MYMPPDVIPGLLTQEWRAGERRVPSDDDIRAVRP